MNKSCRRGLAVPEWFCLLGLLGIGLFWFTGSMSDDVNTDLTKTNENILNPSSIANRYSGSTSSGSASTSDGSSSTTSASSSRGPQGNNGFGNGGDDGSNAGFQDATR